MGANAVELGQVDALDLPSAVAQRAADLGQPRGAVGGAPNVGIGLGALWVPMGAVWPVWPEEQLRGPVGPPLPRGAAELGRRGLVQMLAPGKR